MAEALQVRAPWPDELEEGIAVRVEEVVRAYRRRTQIAIRAARLPESLVFVDTEATGVCSSDRMVSMAAIRIETGALGEGVIDARFAHIVCNPGRRSHSAARRKHGFSDAVLRQQPLFGEHAPEVLNLFQSSALMVAHNASFDVRLINHELSLAGLPSLSVPSFCTMEAARAAGLGNSLSLADMARRIGLVRRSHLHDAAEDAWLTMRVFLWLAGSPVAAEFPSEFARPTNVRG